MATVASLALTESPEELDLELVETITDGPDGGDGPSRSRFPGVRRVLSSRLFWALGIGAVALLVRWVAVSTSYDIFIDEATYTNIAINVAHGRGLALYGQPFTLHPPAAFGLYGLAILAFGLHGTTETVLFGLRHVALALGAATCVLAFLLTDRAVGHRVVGRWAAIAVGFVAALDPLAISYDSRVMLEAPSQLAMATMVLLLAQSLRSPPNRRRYWLLGAGAAGAAVLSTKETFGLVAVLLLVFLLITGWVVARREALVVLVVTVLGYLCTVLSVVITTGFGSWWGAQKDGALRLVGAHQISGFNSSVVHVSFVSRVLANTSILGMSYVILGLGSVASLLILWQLRPWDRRSPRVTALPYRTTILCTLWTVSAGAYLAYATLFGTLEEQMYYILLLPALITLTIGITAFVRSRSFRWRTVGVFVLCGALLFDSVAWVHVHTRHDDEYRRLLSWESGHIPPTAVISGTEYLAQFLLTRGVIGQWSTVTELKAHAVDYVILGTDLATQGYGLAQPNFESYLEKHATLVFEANGASDGSLRVYNVESITGASP